MDLDHPAGTEAWAPRQSPVTADARFRALFQELAGTIAELRRDLAAAEARIAALERAAAG